MSDYELLKGTVADKDKVRQYAQLKTDIEATERKLERLRRLQRENKRLDKHVWRTNFGQHLAFFDIPDDHLKNIINMLERSYTPIPDILMEEVEKRSNIIDLTAALQEGEKKEDEQKDEKVH